MNPRETPREARLVERLDSLRAEPELRVKLARLSRRPDDAYADDQAHADAMLARIAWCRLAEPGDGAAGALLAALGPTRALGLLVSGSSPQAIASAVSDAGVDLTARTIQAGVGRWFPRLNRSDTVADVDRALAHGLSAVIPEEPTWPSDAFAGLGSHVPIMLWARGDVELLRRRSLSVVGARAATGYGAHVTAELVDGLCASGLAIVSGAAYGIDAVAHRTALAAQAPTIAVLAGGADRAYPAAHDALLERIGRQGLVCSEMVPGSAPTRWRFRMRNRIIAALSGATLVTEAGVRSGTLNTAGHVAELGRALGAVPGPVTSAASAGCHKLIREYDATLVTNVSEAREMAGVADGIDLRSEGGGVADAERTPPLHERLLDAMPLRGLRTLDDIARRAGLQTAEARGGLAELELLGKARRGETPGGDEAKWGLPRRR